MSDDPTGGVYPDLYVPEDGPDAPKRILLKCGLCGTTKAGETRRALYEMAFHYDRRHKGWTEHGIRRRLPCEDPLAPHDHDPDGGCRVDGPPIDVSLRLYD